MSTFSPNYNNITVVVNERQYDSMHSWIEPRESTYPRHLNQLGMWPIVGGAVAVYRGLTGIVDVIAGIAKFIIGEAGCYQIFTGASNIIRASIEIIPTAVFVYGMMHGLHAWWLASILSLSSALAVFLVLQTRDWLQSLCPKDTTALTAPVTIFYDNTPAIELYPRKSCSYRYEHWLEEADKYGRRIDDKFIFV